MKVLSLIPIAGMAAMLCLSSASAWAQKQETEKAMTVTGCLAKADQPNEYKITDNGVTYDLYSTANVNMADHVGHKITVTGKSANPQTTTTDKSTGQRLDVTNVKMVSKTCP